MLLPWAMCHCQGAGQRSSCCLGFYPVEDSGLFGQATHLLSPPAAAQAPGVQGGRWDEARGSW